MGDPEPQPDPSPETDPVPSDDALEASGEAEVLVQTPVIRAGTLRSTVGCLSSLVIHLLVVILLALWMVPGLVKTVVAPLEVRVPDDRVEELETTFLDEQEHAAKELSFAVASGDPTLGAENSQAEKFSDVEVDDSLLEDPIGVTVDIDGMLAAVAGRSDLIEEVPEGTPGKGRAVVDGYQEAIDRITREILLMLYKQRVLVVWCFDQSESMKDDQQEIRDRIERVYEELGLSDRASGDALHTVITSYGKSFIVHTKAPTGDYAEIRAAIDQVPIDPSGEEMMCRAVGQSISLYRDYAIKGQRRMALILVTDESGDREGNVQYLEPAIAAARAARCKIFVLGREAVFGYPYVFFRYRHPQTGRPHWLRVDRGPETAFVEQLQINGFRRRHDAHPSGFGPYEQSRMARESGGIFFLLPSVESSLVRGDNRRYELEAMRWYHPDLRSRQEIFFDRDKHELRSLVWKVINDLNPYSKTKAKVVEVRDNFSPDFRQFVGQAQENKAKALLLIQYMAEASKVLEEKAFLRERESEIRWKANYDLICAQLIAYQARLYEYGAYLDQFVKNPVQVPLQKPPNLRLTHWDIRTRKKTLTGEQIDEHVRRSNELFEAVVEAHPGTPWAARAEWEMRRGYGVELKPVYEPPYKQISNPDPLPKL